VAGDEGEQHDGERHVRRFNAVGVLGVGLLPCAAHLHRLARKSTIARLVASGADRCGQCPVASRVTRVEPGIAWWTKAPTSRGGDHVLGAFQYQRRHAHPLQVVP
jgi:hypothetical protein